MIEQSTAALRVAGSILTQYKYLNVLQIVVPGLRVRAWGLYVCKRTQDTGFIPGRGMMFFKRNDERKNPI